MSDQQDKQEMANLQRINAELTQSLERCRFLLADCRSKLAANSNEELIEDDEEAGRERPLMRWCGGVPTMGVEPEITDDLHR